MGEHQQPLRTVEVSEVNSLDYIKQTPQEYARDLEKLQKRFKRIEWGAHYGWMREDGTNRDK